MSYRMFRGIRLQTFVRPINESVKRSIRQFASQSAQFVNKSSPQTLVRLSGLSLVILGIVAPVEGETVIRSLNQSIKLFAAPFSPRGAAEVGVRMSAIQTKAGVVLYNPIPFDAATKRALHSWSGNNQVEFIIAPNLAHHLFVDAAAALYPDAKIIGPVGLAAKHPSIDRSRFHEIDQPDGSGVPAFPYNEIELAYFPDFTYKEICMNHVASKTVFMCDMFFNYPANEQYSQVADRTRAEKGMTQKFIDRHLNAAAYEHDRFAKFMQWVRTKPTVQFKQQAHRIVHDWKPQVIVPLHGDVVDKDATELITKRFASELGSK